VVAANVGDLASAVCPTSGRLTPPEDIAALTVALNAALARPAPVSPRAFVAARFDGRNTLNAYAGLLKV
jgi:hypothetical protein